ncbi:hypothetical protein [Lacipirellula parvula]|uniref:Peptidase S1 domain-containing protein n=1 Tax=Lacipirellula parvula TaxID=2650471 RepID=A0A5K7X965_9BACT|nr:hypothetical protein [Lacipirellula parvula]BBO33230.1 hypothetical protein PLANPX_2842 [Lacipirellula parvula]
MAVEFVEKAHYWDPVAMQYNPLYIPPTLPRPSDSIMAKVQSSSGVVIAPNWILTAWHITNGESFKPVGISVNGVPYSVVDEILDAPGDMALLRIGLPDGDDDPWNNSPTHNLPANFTDYAGIDPDLEVPAGSTITQGGFGDAFLRDPGTGFVISGQGPQGHLRWGKNVVTNAFGGPSINYNFSSVEEIEFEGHGLGNDSGGGYFVKDGWDWRLAGITRDVDFAASAMYAPNYSWIATALGGDLPSLTYASKPSSNVAWIGAANGAWITLANWEDLDTPGSNNKLPTATDVVEITTISGPQIGSGVNAVARSLLVGRSTVNPADAAKMTIATGGQIKADQIFVGEGASDIGKVDITGGAVAVDTEYVGFRGQGSVAHTGGTNTAAKIIIGKDNNGLGGTYTLTGAASAGSTPVVNVGAIEIGDEDSSSGEFIISGGSFATVNSETVIAGKNGEGVFTQQKGQHSVSGSLVIGKNSGSDGLYELSSPGILTSKRTVVSENGIGAFFHSGGKLTTEELKIGANGHYLKTLGTTQAEIVEVTGEFAHMGGTLETRKIVGEIDFVNGSSLVKANGLADYSAANFTNALNTELLIGEESLVLLGSAGQFGAVTPLGDLAPHIVGSTLEVSDGGFRGIGAISDPVEFYDGAYAIASDSGEKFLSFEGGFTAVSGSSTLDTDGSDGFLFGNSGLQIDSGAVLALGGGATLESSAASISVEGALALPPRSATSQGLLSIDSNSTSPHVAIEFDSGAQLQIVAKGAASSSQYDRILIESSNAIELTASLDGELSLELASYSPSPRDVMKIISVSDACTISGNFATVSVDGGDVIIDSLDIAMAVLYDWPGVFGGGVAVRATLPGDFNLDDEVDSEDVGVWLDNFGLTGATWKDGDINGDGAVDGYDWIPLQSHIGDSWPSLVSVPEPASAAMLLMCGVALGARRIARKRT